jgi:hypothetical protein
VLLVRQFSKTKDAANRQKTNKAYLLAPIALRWSMTSALRSVHEKTGLLFDCPSSPEKVAKKTQFLFNFLLLSYEKQLVAPNLYTVLPFYKPYFSA